MQIKITATEPQAAFLALSCKFPAFIAGYGTGKSEVMCNSALLDSLEGGAASLIAMYEPTYDLVRLILAPRMEEKLIDWGVRYKYNKSENIIYTSSGQIGDFVLRTLDNPSRIVGYESFRAKIDEIDTLKKEHAEEAWIKIIARNRQKPDTYQKQSDKPINTVSIFSTPEGFKFAYDNWAKEPAPGYEMVQAATMSNPFLPEDYVQALRDSYPENLIDAYLEGQFVNLTSGTVYVRFDRKLNNSDREWNGKEALHIGMDFNVGRMCSVAHVIDKGLPIAIDEITGGYDTPDMIRMVKQRYWKEIGQDKFQKTCEIYIYPDSSGKNRKSVGASETDISLLEKEGFKLRYKSTNPAVRDRVNAMNAMFCNGKQERRYLVNVKKCPNYSEKLEQQVYKNGEPEKDGTEDVNDAGGYFIAYEYPIIKPIANINVSMAR